MAKLVCAVASGKGGVGRTTSALNIGSVLEQFDHDTVVIDADLSMSDVGALLDVDVDVGIHDVLAGEASLSEASVTLPTGLTVIPGSRSLDAYAAAEAANLKPVINQVSKTADVVLIDTGAGLSHATTLSLGIADSVLLVTTPAEVSVLDAAKTGQLTERLDSEVAGALVTRVTERADLEAVEEALDVPVLGGIPVDTEAAGTEPLTIKALESRAADAYTKCTRKFVSVCIDGQVGPSFEPAFNEAWLPETDATSSIAVDELEEPEAEEEEPEEEEIEDDDDDDDDDSPSFAGGALPVG